jgi:hypothetical protein
VTGSLKHPRRPQPGSQAVPRESRRPPEPHPADVATGRDLVPAACRRPISPGLHGTPT